ncbi:MAG: YceI family protein [Planctomycetota bacterium]|jgi:polyisoprenoid-binding protein YceI|nr:YceI family protein [Planctomycetota bacterium]MDP6762557.1 YceI family protein [Planctomycetota bacterium]MDP6990461.1 YceI family protein [Planctomycetota bacterium]
MNHHAKTSAVGGVALSLLIGAAALARGAALAPDPADGAQYTIDATHSNVLFKVSHFRSSLYYGRFNEVSGEFTFDAADPAASSVRMVVRADSVDAKVENLSKHLRSPDFLDATQFPEIVFESKSVEAGEAPDTLEVSGELTLRGVTRPLTVTVEKVGEGPGMRGARLMGWHARFTIDRGEFGVDYGIERGAVGREVELIVSVEGHAR